MNKECILVVDDEPLVFESIEDTLGEDYQLYHANNGEVGLTLLEAHRPILILLDLRLPVMNGFEFLERLGVTADSPYSVIVLSGHAVGVEVNLCYKVGATAFLRKPFNTYELKGVVEQAVLAKKTQQALEDHRDRLEEMVEDRTTQLTEKVETIKQTETALRKEMGNLLAVHVVPGVLWLQIPEAGLYILCGCPAEVVKHLMRRGLIHTVEKGGVAYETGPNVILLSELLVQNGGFANLSEFPVLQMLYRQGMILPGHPNNTGAKPMLIGSSAQVRAQMEYIHRGKHGLVSKEEMMACGVDEATAENMMRVKLKFAFGSIQPPSQMLDSLHIDETPVPIRNGVTVARIGFNRYRFAFRERTADVDMNLSSNVLYPPAYALGNHRFKRQYFAVLHRGEGDGWDMDRPSMGSIIMFQGHIYLIDAGPGVFYTMMALGIDISEVEGIFHTHGHDDHFAGLPALIHSDHRLKYFATPPVRAAVAKKFTALMSMEEEKFGQFFEICDLTLDVWNDCDGLEVMPLYSPHPTETNLFLFRALDIHGYKSYAHWADLSSYTVMDEMVGDGPMDVPAAFFDKVKQDYKRFANLKKLDIGGGQIHGVAEDFRDDPSDYLILAHIDRALTTEEMTIGSESSFGALDVLIKGDQDYLHARAFTCLNALFPDVRVGQIRMLLNSPIMEYNAGTILRRSGEGLEHVDMILAGTVVYLESKPDVHNHLALGSFIGEGILFKRQATLKGTYRAFSHCSVIRFSTTLLRAFFANNGLLDQMEKLLDRIWFLRRTWLFGGQTTFLFLGDISRTMELLSMPAGTDIMCSAEPRLWVVLEGQVHLCDETGRVLEIIQEGGFFGEQTGFSCSDFPGRLTTVGAVRLYRLDLASLLKIPIVHWKMLEIFERRQKLFLAS